jgi:hypothetical protein
LAWPPLLVMLQQRCYRICSVTALCHQSFSFIVPAWICVAAGSIWWPPACTSHQRSSAAIWSSGVIGIASKLAEAHTVPIWSWDNLATTSVSALIVQVQEGEPHSCRRRSAATTLAAVARAAVAGAAATIPRTCRCCNDGGAAQEIAVIQLQLRPATRSISSLSKHRPGHILPETELASL